MRHFFLVVAMLSIYNTNAQIKKTEAGTVFFEQVYDVPEMNQQQIKSAVNEWLAITFKDANHVIKMNTDDKIVNNGLVKSYYDWKGIIVELTNEFNMITEFKDGRFRLTIDNIIYKTSSGDSYPISWDPESLSKEKFRKDLQAMVDGMEDGQVKRINEKILKNDKKFNEHYETVALARNKIYNSVIPEMESIAASLNAYVQKANKSNEEW